MADFVFHSQYHRSLADIVDKYTRFQMQHKAQNQLIINAISSQLLALILLRYVNYMMSVYLTPKLSTKSISATSL